MGTSQDMLDLLDGNAEHLADLEGRIAAHLGFDLTLTAVGQVYPRSLDFDVLSSLVQIGAGPSSLATSIRLMAGHELVTEGFQPGQVGSSAMPHKMNTRSCEQVNGFQIILRGCASMAAELAGGQWNEGDVSCSVVRRVALPDAFFALDGVLQTLPYRAGRVRGIPRSHHRELDRYLPFLATTKVLLAAVRAGVGRETAHEVIKTHAVDVALDMRGEAGGSGDGTHPTPRRRRATGDIRGRAADPARRAAGIHRRGPGTSGSGRATVARIAAEHPGAAEYAPSRSCRSPPCPPAPSPPDYPLPPGYTHEYSGKVRDLWRTPAGNFCSWPPTGSRPTTGSFHAHPGQGPHPDRGQPVVVRPTRRHLRQPRGLDRCPCGGRRAGDGVPPAGHDSRRCVARGYLTGSGLAEYRTTGMVCGNPLPAGLVDGSELPQAIFTPRHQGRDRGPRREHHLRPGRRAGRA